MENETRENRAFPRKPMNGRGGFIDAISGNLTPVDLLDISIGGVSFLAATACTKGSMRLVRFELNGKTVRGVVRIVYCVKHSLADAYRMGAEFKDLEEQYLTTIQHYLE